jgi:hypothetical protein
MPGSPGHRAIGDLLMTGIWWGRAKENGIWLASVPRRRLCWRGHDSLYVAASRLRLRLRVMKWPPRGC